jgi:hypothetical protein
LYSSFCWLLHRSTLLGAHISAATPRHTTQPIIRIPFLPRSSLKSWHPKS